MNAMRRKRGRKNRGAIAAWIAVVVLVLPTLSGKEANQMAASKSGFVQDPLPYADAALEPYISAKTIGFHYGKHHKAYVDKANELIKGTDLEKMTGEEIIRATAGIAEKTAVFNNAAQAWNHAFFWKGMKADGGGQPSGLLADKIKASFGSFENFRKEFVDAALAQFGSGWVWLVEEGGKLKVTRTANADTPLARGQKCLLVADVWEHAYYLDYQNRRKDFVEAFLDHLVNWDFVASRL
jgi:superoxide dismutase, Fe-Mn family